MNKKKIFIIISALIVLAVLSAICCFSLLKKNEKTFERDFSLNIIDNKFNINVGESILYEAQLENLSDNNYTISHGIPLIILYVYNEGDVVEHIFFASLVTEDFEAGEIISKTLSIKIDEPGEYMLGAICKFDVNGENITIEAEPKKIIVTESESVDEGTIDETK